MSEHHHSFIHLVNGMMGWPTLNRSKTFSPLKKVKEDKSSISLNESIIISNEAETRSVLQTVRTMDFKDRRPRLPPPPRVTTSNELDLDDDVFIIPGSVTNQRIDEDDDDFFSKFRHENEIYPYRSTLSYRIESPQKFSTFKRPSLDPFDEREEAFQNFSRRKLVERLISEDPSDLPPPLPPKDYVHSSEQRNLKVFINRDSSMSTLNRIPIANTSNSYRTTARKWVSEADVRRRRQRSGPKIPFAAMTTTTTTSSTQKLPMAFKRSLSWPLISTRKKNKKISRSFSNPCLHYNCSKSRPRKCASLGGSLNREPPPRLCRRYQHPFAGHPTPPKPKLRPQPPLPPLPPQPPPTSVPHRQMKLERVPEVVNSAEKNRKAIFRIAVIFVSIGILLILSVLGGITYLKSFTDYFGNQTL